jgi:putative transposase
VEHQSDCVHKCYKYKLMPTPEQEQALACVVSRCQTLYNCALEQRRTWWGRGQVKSASYSQQARELPDLKAACPDYGGVHSHVLQEVLRRVDKTDEAFFRRLANGETPGYPRLQGANR